jgi:hypothetical protein
MANGTPGVDHGVTGPTAAARACARAPADTNRALGSLARACATTSSTDGGTDGTNADGDGGTSLTCAIRTAIGESFIDAGR